MLCWRTPRSPAQGINLPAGQQPLASESVTADNIPPQIPAPRGAVTAWGPQHWAWREERAPGCMEWIQKCCPLHPAVSRDSSSSVADGAEAPGTGWRDGFGDLGQNLACWVHPAASARSGRGSSQGLSRASTFRESNSRGWRVRVGFRCLRWRSLWAWKCPLDASVSLCAAVGAS